MSTTTALNSRPLLARRGFLAGLGLMPLLAVPVALARHEPQRDQQLLDLAAQVSAFKAYEFDYRNFHIINELARDALAHRARTRQGVAAKREIATFTMCEHGSIYHHAFSERLQISAEADLAVIIGDYTLINNEGMAS
jgi:hypothetical protein